MALLNAHDALRTMGPFKYDDLVRDIAESYFELKAGLQSIPPDINAVNVLVLLKISSLPETDCRHYHF